MHAEPNTQPAIRRMNERFRGFLPVVIDVSETTQLVSEEPNQICNLRWVDRAELVTMALEDRLENWSKIMVDEELV